MDKSRTTVTGNGVTEIIGSTPFDDVYRTLTTKITKLVIPLINEMFGTTYPEDESIRQISSEHYTKNGKIITDSIFEIRDVFYHVECQSGNDAAMSILMFEYDVSIAIKNVEEIEGETIVRFPRSAVLYVRDNGSTPDEHLVRIILPNGREARYLCSAMKVSNYSLEDIFDRNLLIILPYYILRYEKSFDRMNADDRLQELLLEDLQELMKKLDEATNQQGKIVLFEDLHLAIRKVADHVLRKNEYLHEEVNAVMGGNVFKLPSDYIAEGKAEGILLERIAAVTKKVKRGQELPIIAEALEYDEDSIRTIYDAVRAAAPDYDSEQILRKILEEK